MSGSQIHRSAAVSESNIPIPKRMSTKKPKRCAQLPELQKYIETIIKASNECDSEDTSLSDKDRFPKERKFGRYSIQRGTESKTKNEKIKNDLNAIRSKNNIKPKTPVVEAVSRGVQINSKSLAPEFEDPRNWNLTKTQNLGPSVEIEKFLKQFYPNPYHLENVNEFKDSKVDEKDHLRDGTLPDVVISKANIHTEVDIEKTDYDLDTADIELKPCKRESKTTSVTSDPISEKRDESPAQSDSKDPEEANPPRTRSQGKNANFPSNTSSQGSSAESLSDTTHRKESQMNFKKRKTVKTKNRSKPLKSEGQCDYDIGKLKLLNTTDSDDSERRGKKTKIKDATDLTVDEKSSSQSEETYKVEELSDLKEIYDVMYKATESFLQISSQAESTVRSEVLTDNETFPKPSHREDTKLCDYDSDIKENNSDRGGNETNPIIKEKAPDEGAIESPLEKNFQEEEKSPVKKSLINVLLKEDKYEFKSSPEDAEPEQVQEPVQEPVQEQACSSTNYQSKEKKNDTDDAKATDVLEYMYDCLKKFNTKKQAEEESNFLQEDKKTVRKTTSCRKLEEGSTAEIPTEKPTTSASAKQTDITCAYQKHSIESLLEKNFPQIRNIQCKYAAALDEINRKPGNKMRGRRRPLHVFTRDLPPARNKRNALPPLMATSSHTNFEPETVRESTADLNEDDVVLAPITAESQNELGGWTEETNGAQTSEEARIPKPVLPLSVKRKCGRMNNLKTLKNVLEAEEKLLSVEFNGEESKKENEGPTGLVTSDGSNENVESTKVHSRLGDITRTTSSFVVCVNPFPRNMKSVTSIRPTFPIPGSASLGNLKKSGKMATFYPKLPLRKISLPLVRESYVLIHNYVVQQEVSWTLHKTATLYAARPVCSKHITNLSNVAEEAPLKTSECLVQIIVKPVQQSVVVESENAVVSAPESTLNTEDDKPVEALIEAVEETEEKVFLLEQKTDSVNNLYSRHSGMVSPNERLKFEFPEHDVEIINDKKKIHELLLRTYNLQQKLQRYLEKITSAKQATTSCPVMQCNLVDASVKNKSENEFEVKPNYSLPVVHWHLQTVASDTKPQTDEFVATNGSMVDHGTSYDPPPVEEIYEKSEMSNNEAKESNNEEEESNNRTKESPKYEKDDGFSEEMKNDEDDRSSTYSFKSSNDFSVSTDTQNPAKEETNGSDKTSSKFYKKIFNEIELFRQSFEADKIERRKLEEANPKGGRDSTDRQLTHYDPKIPAKVLKTVFKGKKSLTELTIGLKDVPMTKVGNISVEKTKFSANHTKISISISKERTIPYPKDVSSYYFDNMRPSLSTCLTEYSRLKDVESKTSDSPNEETDDEDDYKSVGSTLGNSDSEPNEEEKTDPKEEKTPEVTPSKSFTKHRFDFYRKMTPDLDSNRSKPKSQTNSMCRYKELEPLKQALTDMQIRMRNIKREAGYDSNDYFERALKLAKMSAGFCQSCGNRAVIPNDTFGYYRTLLPRRYSHHRRNRHFRPNLTSTPSYYSLRSSDADINDQFYDLGIRNGSYLLNPTIPKRTVLRTSLHDMPILFERI